MNQTKLLQTIIRLLPKGRSLNDALATALDISYDAAHRRTSLKSKISFEESIRLAAYFNFSLDMLREDVAGNIVAIHKTPQIATAQDLEHYFKTSTTSVAALSQVEKATLYYSAKDIPLFYTLDGSLLSRFKIYVWLRLLSDTQEDIAFESYQIPLSTITAAQELGQLYEEIPKIEIWDTTTYNSTLKQIHFYYQAGLLAAKTAVLLCDALNQLLQNIKKKVSAVDDRFKLYHNELLLMNNTVLIDTPHKKAFYVPFTFLSYFLATDEITCTQAMTYIEKQLKHSKLLNTSGERERNLFFEKLRQKINALRILVEASQVLDFE